MTTAKQRKMSKRKKRKADRLRKEQNALTIHNNLLMIANIQIDRNDMNMSISSGSNLISTSNQYTDPTNSLNLLIEEFDLYKNNERWSINAQDLFCRVYESVRKNPNDTKYEDMLNGVVPFYLILNRFSLLIDESARRFVKDDDMEAAALILLQIAQLLIKVNPMALFQDSLQSNRIFHGAIKSLLSLSDKGYLNMFWDYLLSRMRNWRASDIMDITNVPIDVSAHICEYIGMPLSMRIDKRNGRTLLHELLLYGRSNFVTIKGVTLKAIKYGPDAVLIQDVSGNTPLHLACSQYLYSILARSIPLFEVIENMIKCGRKALSIQNNYGDTPLHLSCEGRSKSTHLISYMLKLSPCEVIQLPNREGNTPRQIALKNVLVEKQIHDINSLFDKAISHAHHADVHNNS